jgi:hypothetical protein
MRGWKREAVVELHALSNLGPEQSTIDIAATFGRNFLTLRSKTIELRVHNYY